MTRTPHKNSDRTTEAADWKRMQFRRNKVWLALDAAGKPMERGGKVLIKYQLTQDYEYWVKSDNVRPLGQKPQNDSAPQRAAKKTQPPEKRSQPLRKNADRSDEEALVIFTDGASSGNPGPAGIGVLLQYRQHAKEISEYIGTATNNIAELKAILIGLRAVKDSGLPVRVFTDSKYAYGLLVLGWKARANLALVEAIRKEMKRFSDLEIKKIKGHAGHYGNEQADRLATAAVKKAQNRK